MPSDKVLSALIAGVSDTTHATQGEIAIEGNPRTVGGYVFRGDFRITSRG